MKIYIERQINGEQDLPKEEGWYIVKCADNENPEFMKIAKKGNMFWSKVAYWLEPIEASDKGAEEIFEIMFGGLNGEKGCYHFPDLKEWVLFCMKEYAAIQVAKALDKENKLSEIEKLAQSVNPYDTRSVKAGRKKFKAALNGEIKKEQ